ncbi:hormonally up-regulated neu tumor-associated kinase homolog A-like [Gastrophryne carolinensis]
MPVAINALYKDSLERIAAESKTQNREMQILTCFSKIPEDIVKNFSHTKRVGNYLVGRMINKGSFAKVMEGMHIPTGQKVAMKVIDKKKAKQDSYVLKNMKREPRLHQMVKHPNIVQLYETLETENSYYMVMELCEGGDLMDRICDKKKLEEKEVRKYARQIMSAVEHLHRHGIVHRDLKIENYLLDENGNIKIVDLGLSNTIKGEGLAQELLSTQCGSPAYAAPELLANKKYGPKVDVWSVGVSIYAMLTGTLPFTVEPFNIKQLHQKMVNLEINPMPRGVSTGAIDFLHMLLEPDPTKRPSVKEAMDNKWLNEGFIRKHLSSNSYKNRLRPDELNATVLSHMASTMDIDISKIIHMVVNNKPSPITASYYLLLKEIRRKSSKYSCKNEDTGDRDRTKYIEKHNGFHFHLEEVQNENQEDKNNKSPLLYEPIQEDEIALTLDNQENILKASKFAGREVIYLEPPDSSRKETLDTSTKLTSLKNKDLNQQDHPCENNIKKDSSQIKTNWSAKFQIQQPYNPTGSPIGKAMTMPLNRQVQDLHSSLKEAPNFKDLISTDGNIPPDCHQNEDGESHNLVLSDTTPLSTLPKLRQPTGRENFTKRISWVTSQHAKIGSAPIIIHSTRPPLFPMSRQKTIIVKSLGQSKEKSNLTVDNFKVKRNMVQLTSSHKTTNLNLPLLLPNYQKSSEKKRNIVKLEIV